MLVLVVFVGLALTAALSMAMVPMSRDLTDRQQARSAADAAALAGVISDRSASADMASRNGAEMIGWSERGSEVTVTVRVGDQVVVARATDGP
jgi:hypothetical protein